MSWFKPAAGLIILVFVLVILFSLFNSHQEDVRFAEVQKSQRDATLAKSVNYYNCMDGVESTMAMRRIQAGSYLEKIKNNGELTNEINACVVKLNNLLIAPPASQPDFLNKHNKMMWDQCENDIMQGYSFAKEMEKEQAEMKLECENKYGN